MNRTHHHSTLALVCAAALLQLAAASPVAAADYSVRSLVDSTSGISFIALPVIDDADTVYFGGAVPQPNDPLNPARGNIYQVRNGVLTPSTFLLNSSGNISQLAVTRGGVVTFNGSGFTVNDVRTPQGIYRMDPAGTVTRVIDDAGPYLGIGNFAAARSDATTPPLAFTSSTDTGGFTTAIYNGPDPLANKVVDGTSPFGPILATSLQSLAADGTPRLIGTKPGAGTPVIYKGPDPQRDVVMDLSRFSNVFNYQENSTGDARFVAQLPSGVVGLYSGPDPSPTDCSTAPPA